MKRYALIALLILCCTAKEKKSKVQRTTVKPNFYDLFYLERPPQYGRYSNSNIDSLIELVNLDKHFEELIFHGFFDSTTVNQIKKKNKLNTVEYKIKVSDSIKNLINQTKKGNFKHLDYFSKPYYVTQEKCFVFWDSNFGIGASDGVVIFSKRKSNLWKLDTVKIFNNYRLNPNPIK